MEIESSFGGAALMLFSKFVLSVLVVDGVEAEVIVKRAISLCM